MTKGQVEGFTSQLSGQWWDHGNDKISSNVIDWTHWIYKNPWFMVTLTKKKSINKNRNLHLLLCTGYGYSTNILPWKLVIKGNTSSLFLPFLNEPYFRVIASSWWGTALLYRFLGDKCRSYVCLALLGHSLWRKSATLWRSPCDQGVRDLVQAM